MASRESDVQLAAASNAIIIGFNVRADSAARDAIKETGVDVRYYSIIYEAIDDVKAAVSGLLPPEVREQIRRHAEVREVFRSPKFGRRCRLHRLPRHVAERNPIRVLRDNVVIYEGELESLRRFKDDVKKSEPAPNAASASRTTTTSRPGIRSSATIELRLLDHSRPCLENIPASFA